MRIYIVLLFLSVKLFSCANMQTTRDVSELDLDDCEDLVGSLISNSEIEKIVDEQVLVQKTLSTARSFAEYNEIINSYFSIHLYRGNSKFLANNKFIFESNMNSIQGASGNINEGLYEAEHMGRKYIIKQINKLKQNDALLNEIQNIKILEELRLHPKTEIVQRSETYFLVMEEVGGINIKEVIYPEFRVQDTKDKLDNILGYETSNIEQAVRDFSRKILDDPDLLKEMERIQSSLEIYGFQELNDFQFMIDPQKSFNPISIIDVELFKRSDEDIVSDFTPENEFKKIKSTLIELSQ